MGAVGAVIEQIERLQARIITPVPDVEDFRDIRVDLRQAWEELHATRREDDSVVLAETEDEVQQPAAAKAASVGASQPAKRGVAPRWP